MCCYGEVTWEALRMDDNTDGAEDDILDGLLVGAEDGSLVALSAGETRWFSGILCEMRWDR